MDQKVMDAIPQLRAVLQGIKNAPESKVGQMMAARDEVLARFQPVFNSSNIANLKQEDFRDFLLMQNNKHWSGLHRRGGRAGEDMPALRKALALLLDESKPIETRLDKLIPHNRPAKVTGLGRALVTAILFSPTRIGTPYGTALSCTSS